MHVADSILATALEHAEDSTSVDSDEHDPRAIAILAEWVRS